MSSNCGTLTVEEAFDAGNVTVDCTGFSTDIIEVGQETDIIFEFTNTNDVNADVDYDILVDGIVEASDDVLVGANGSDTLEVGVVFDNAGNFDVDVEIVSVSQA